MLMMKKHLTCYLYTEGYLRTSSVKFSLDEKKLKNILMHLTNDGIQNKDSKNYGKHEQGNKISYEKVIRLISILNKGGVENIGLITLPINEK